MSQAQARFTYNPEFLYLTTTGRKSGRLREIEIWYVEHGGCYYLCAENRERADWVRNLVADPNVAFWVEQRSLTGTARIVDDEDLATEVRHLFDEQHGWSDGLLVQLRPD